MTTHTIISDYKNDNINTFYIENNFIAVVKKEDFTTFKEMNIYNNAGICILISDEKSSIKKISTSIFDYIDQYCSQNTWWKTLLFIGNVDNNVSDIELSYIKQLISNKLPEIDSEDSEEHPEYEKKVELDIAQKIQSEKTVEIITWVIDSYTNLDLFKNKPNKSAKNVKKENNNNDEVLNNILNAAFDKKEKNPSIIFDDMKFSETSMRQLLIKFVSYLVIEGHSKEMIKNFYDEPVPTASKFLGSEHKFGASGDKLTDNITGTDLVMYSRYNRSGIIRTFNNIAAALKKPIRIDV